MTKGGVIAWVTATAERQDMIGRSVARCRPEMGLVLLSSGSELMAYLLGDGSYVGAEDMAAPRLLFVDAALPEGSALAVVRRVKEDPLFRRIPLIVFAEPDWEGDVEAMYHAGANAFMTLPITLEDVCGVVATSLEFWLDGARLPGEAFSAKPRPGARQQQSWFDYRILDEHRLGVAELSGRITGPDLLDSIDRFLGDPRLQPGYKILADYTGASEVEIGLGEAREIATALLRFRKQLESGQTAVVVSDLMHLLIGEVLIAMGTLDRSRIRVFTSMPAAAEWLRIPETAARIARPAL